MVWKDVIPWIISLGMFVLTLIALARNGKKDLKQEYSEELSKIHEIEQSIIKLCTKMDVLQHTMEETRQEIKVISDGLQELKIRVHSVEQEQKTMWLRIDEIKGKVEHYHEGN